MKQAEIEIVLSNGQKAGESLKELTSQANQLNNAIKKAKIGSEEFNTATKDYQAITGRLKDVRAQVNGVAEAQKVLSSELAGMIPFSGQIKSFSQSFSNIRGAIGGATKGMQAFKVALLGTGIGAIVVAFGALITYLASTQEGLDKINSVLKPLGTILQKTLGLVQDLGGKAFKGLGEAIKNPKKALEDFGNFIKDQFLNRIKSIGVAWEGIQLIFDGKILEGSKKLGDALMQNITGVENLSDKMMAAGKAAGDWLKEGVDQGQRLHELTIAIEKAEISLIRNRDMLLAKAKQYNDVVENEMASTADRQAAAEEALNIQRKVMEMDKAVIDMKIEKMKLEQSLNDTSREQQKELAELEAESFKKQMEIQEMMTTMRNKLNVVTKKAADEQQKIEDEQLQAMADKAQAEQDLLMKQLEEINALRKKNYDDNAANLDIATESERIRIEEAFADRLITEQERQDQLYQLEVDRLQKQLEAQVAYYGAESNEAKKATNALASFKVQARTKDVSGAKKTEQEKGDAALEGAQTATNTASWLFGNLASMYDEGSEKYKRMAFYQSEIAAIESAMQSYKSGAAIGGPPVGAIYAALSFAFSNIQMTKMKKVKKAEHGALLHGSRHSAGGIMVNAEDGEIILNRNVSRDPRGLIMASELNSMFGGIRFMAQGGPVNPFTSSTVTPQVPTTGQGSFTGNSEDLGKKLDVLIGLFAAYPTILQVHNNVQDTQQGINVVNKLEKDAGF